MSLLSQTTRTSLHTAAETPRTSRAHNARLVTAGPRLWRLLDARGRAIGHIHAVLRGDDVRYRALRFHVPSRVFRDMGEFWSADDAVDCLVFAR